MRFRKMQITNFRSHVDTTLDLTRLTVIRGPNHAGKSSVEQAIQITVASRADGTTSDGKGSIGLIRAGNAKAAIKLAAVIDGEERILQCALNGTACTTIVTKADDPQWTGGTDWKKWLTTHREVLSCLCNNRHFVDLNEDDQKDVLSAIILPKTYTWPEWVIPSVTSFGLKVDFALTPFEIIAQAYKATFAERTVAKRNVKEFKTPEGSTEGAENYEEFAAKLATRREELEALVSAQTARKSTAEASGRLLQAANKRLEESRARLSREEQGMTTIEANLLSSADVKKHEKIAKGAVRAIALDAEIQRLDTEISISKKSLAALNELSSTPTCPTCASALTEEVMAALATPVVAAINDFSTLRQSAIDERKALGNPGDSGGLLARHETAQTDMKNAKGRIAEDQTVIKDAEAQVFALESNAKVDETAADAEIADIRKRIEVGTTAVNAAKAAKDLLARKETAASDKATLLQKEKDIIRLVEYFDSEVKTELLASSIGTFTDAMNTVLAGWGYTCQLSIEPYVFAVMFRDSDNMPHPIALKHLSKSEKYRFATAFQVALAIVSGFKFVITDEADIFDAAGRGNLFEALNSDALDQAIILATDERLAVPEVDGATFYRFDDIATEGMIPTTQVSVLTPAA